MERKHLTVAEKKRILTMFKKEGKSRLEIATELQKPYGTVNRVVRQGKVTRKKRSDTGKSHYSFNAVRAIDDLIKKHETILAGLKAARSVL